MCSEDHARAVLAPVATGLVAVLEGGWDKYLEEGIPRRNRTTRANIVNDYHHELMIEHVPAAQPTKAPRSDKPFYLLGGLTLRLKYLRSMTPSNVSTGVQVAVAEQLKLDLAVLAEPEQLVLEGLAGETAPTPEPPFINVGYVLDNSEAEVEGVLAVMYEGTNRCWAIDLRDLAAGTGTSPVVLPVDPTGPVEPALPAIAAKGAAAESSSVAPPLPPVASSTIAAPTGEDRGELAESS